MTLTDDQKALIRGLYKRDEYEGVPVPDVDSALALCALGLLEHTASSMFRLTDLGGRVVGQGLVAHNCPYCDFVMWVDHEVCPRCLVKAQTPQEFYDATAAKGGRFVVVIERIDTAMENWLVGCTGVFLDDERILFDPECIEGWDECHLPIYDAEPWLTDYAGKFEEETRDSRHDIILGTLDDLVADFMYYDREDGDSELPPGAIERAIAAGEITVDEIVARFRAKLEARFS